MPLCLSVCRFKSPQITQCSMRHSTHVLSVVSPLHSLSLSPFSPSGSVYTHSSVSIPNHRRCSISLCPLCLFPCLVPILLLLLLIIITIMITIINILIIIVIITNSWINKYMNKYINKWISLYNIYMYVCVYIYIYIYTYVCMYVCVYIYIYIHTHAYVTRMPQEGWLSTHRGASAASRHPRRSLPQAHLLIAIIAINDYYSYS